MSTNTRVALCAAVILLASACGADDGNANGGGGEFVFNNQLFSNTQLLSPAASGDMHAPSFSWPATGERHVVCAVFRKRIAVRQDRIENEDDMVWVWHSGMRRGREGNVRWDDGRPGPSSTDPPRSLPAGTYYWALWTLDVAGNPLGSSRELTMNVP
ncbi:MAG: hypothetical protein KC503_44775 [Myxococcales bacterium]|nr:hypothetical protein [Myxococcales bacterium]